MLSVFEMCIVAVIVMCVWGMRLHDGIESVMYMYMYVVISRGYRTGEVQFGGISLAIRVPWHVITCP